MIPAVRLRSDDLNLHRHCDTDPGPAIPAYIDRDKSDLAYIRRILAVGNRQQTPLLEKLRFLKIARDVLDEFIAVRLTRVADRAVASIIEDIHDLRAAQVSTLHWILDRLSWHGLTAMAGSVARPKFTPASLWMPFQEQVMPALTPVKIDREHPFPWIAHLQSGLLLQVKEPSGESSMRVIPIPHQLAAYLTPTDNPNLRVPVESVITTFAGRMLCGQVIEAINLFRVLRVNDLAIGDTFADLRSEVAREVEARALNPVVFVEVDEAMSDATIRFLEGHLGNDHLRGIVPVAWPGVARLKALEILSDVAVHDRNRHELSFPPLQPRELRRQDLENLFTAIRARDIVLHWPFDDFRVIPALLWQAAKDEDVVAIKQSLYRTCDEILAPLEAAARAGKEVTVVLELEARENERENVDASHRLQAAGARVVYGLVGLKVHAKMLLIVRREGSHLREYANFSTGNYHSGNARHYSDLCLFTADRQLARDLTRVFNYVTGDLETPATQQLIAAPLHLREYLLDAINQEISNACAGRPAGIWIKVNSLIDQELIDALYRASQAGVPVHAIVRRHCALVPGQPGLSETIHVRSIMGRFLEHARLVCFANGSALSAQHARIYLATADWMPRNFDQRVELLIPVRCARIRQFLLDFLATNLKDTDDCWWLGADGRYHRPRLTGFSAQNQFAASPEPESWLSLDLRESETDRLIHS